MKRFEEVRNAAVVFVNHKEFKNHVELYDNETGFSFINNDDVVICGYDGDSIEKMIDDLKASIDNLDSNFQNEPYGAKELYTHWELCSGVDSSGKMTNVKIKFIKGEKPIVEFGRVTTTSHWIANTIRDYIYYNS